MNDSNAISLRRDKKLYPALNFIEAKIIRYFISCNYFNQK